MTKFADLPKVSVKDWLMSEELDDLKNNPTGEMYSGGLLAISRFLWHHKSDDFPTDAIPGSMWYDASGKLYQFTQNKTWINFFTGENL